MGFKRALTKNVGTTLTDAYTFTGPDADTLIGLRITNTGAASIKVAACITNSGTDYYLVGGPTVATAGADVPVGSSIVIINGDIDKVVLETGDVVRVISSAVNSCDVIASSLTQ